MNANKLNVDVEKLKKGNYLLKLQVGSKSIIKKFSVE